MGFAGPQFQDGDFIYFGANDKILLYVDDTLSNLNSVSPSTQLDNYNTNSISDSGTLTFNGVVVK